jgi:hypothetical protein
MSEVLHRLVYYSHNRIVGDAEALAASIDKILAVSRVNNRRNDVTGALMFNAGCFAQVLEGPAEAVEQTFDRIQMDERHGDVVLLGVALTEERAFQSWSMAFVGGSVADAARFGAIANVTGYDPANMKRDELFEALYRMTLEHENRS